MSQPREYDQAKLLGRLPAGVADDDDTFGIDDDGLAPAELFQAGRNGIDSSVVDPRIAEVRFDPLDRPKFDKHGGRAPKGSRRPTGC